MVYEIWSTNPKTRATQKKPYIVEAHSNGERWTCTCPDFVIRKKGRAHCKHITKVIEDNHEQERLQAEAAKMFEHGSGVDWEEPPKPDAEDDDVSMAPAI